MDVFEKILHCLAFVCGLGSVAAAIIHDRPEMAVIGGAFFVLAWMVKRGMN